MTIYLTLLGEKGLREVAGQCAHPALLFSGGKDSIVMLRLAEKAFWPARIPFPVVHIDTGRPRRW